MKWFLAAGFVLFLSAASAQENILKDSYILNTSISDLKGQVKQCIENEYTITNDGSYYLADTMPNNILLFDEKRRLIELRSNPTSKGKYYKTLFSYGKSGCLEEIKELFHDGTDYRYWAFACDKHGNIIKLTGYEYLNGRQLFKTNDYTYNDKNHLTEEHKRSGAKEEHCYYEYDVNGFMVKMTIKRKGFDFDLAGDGISEFVNDSTGKPVTEYIIEKNNTRTKFQELFYYENGLLREKVEYLGLAKVRHRYEYEHDHNGNWTTKREYEVDDTGRSVLKKSMSRNLTYY